MDVSERRRLIERRYAERGCQGDMPGVCCPACALTDEDEAKLDPSTTRGAVSAEERPPRAFVTWDEYARLRARADAAEQERDREHAMADALNADLTRVAQERDRLRAEIEALVFDLRTDHPLYDRINGMLDACE